MVKWYNSLTTKLVVCFVVLVLVISGLMFFYTYGETKNALKESIRDNLGDVSGTMASQINSTVIGELKAGDENNADYQGLVAQLRLMRNLSNDITNVYIFKVDGDNLTFLADDAEDGPALIGETYNSSDLKQVQNALVAPTASSDFYTDIWGTFMSGYAPIKDVNGTTVAVLGVDMTADKVLDRQNFIGNTIYAIFIASALIAALLIGYISVTIIRDLKKLNMVAEKISKGDMSAEVDVRRKDEIGLLSDSFSRMVGSLKFEMMAREEEEAAKRAEEGSKRQE